MTISIILLIISLVLCGWSMGDKDARYASGYGPTGFFKKIVSVIGAIIFLGSIVGIIVNW